MGKVAEVAVKTSPEHIFISDFDGTITRRDFFRVALEQLPAECGRWWQAYEDGRLGHFEALARTFAELRISLDQVDELLRAMEPEPELARCCGQLEQNRWQLVIASAGCAWYIQRLLAWHHLHPTIYANPGTFSPSHGLRMTLPAGEFFTCQTTGVDKEAIARHYLERGCTIAFAGDGRPDLKPALLAPPHLRFARGWLAEELTRRQEGFLPFERWAEVVTHLPDSAAQPT